MTQNIAMMETVTHWAPLLMNIFWCCVGLCVGIIITKLQEDKK